MAIPFLMPTDDEAELRYRRIQHLLHEISDAIGDLIFLQYTTTTSTASDNLTNSTEIIENSNEPSMNEDVNEILSNSDHSFIRNDRSDNDNNEIILAQPNAVLPDLILDAIMPSRRRSTRTTRNSQLNHRQHRTRKSYRPNSVTNNQQSSHNNIQEHEDSTSFLPNLHLNLDMEFFRDTFTTLRHVVWNTEPENIDHNVQIKARFHFKMSILCSIFGNGLLSRTVLTTVLLVVGWKLLIRN